MKVPSTKTYCRKSNFEKKSYYLDVPETVIFIIHIQSNSGIYLYGSWNLINYVISVELNLLRSFFLFDVFLPLLNFFAMIYKFTCVLGVRLMFYFFMPKLIDLRCHFMISRFRSLSPSFDTLLIYTRIFIITTDTSKKIILNHML